jgi:hypothetical protein
MNDLAFLNIVRDLKVKKLLLRDMKGLEPADRTLVVFISAPSVVHG